MSVLFAMSYYIDARGTPGELIHEKSEEEIFDENLNRAYTIAISVLWVSIAILLWIPVTREAAAAVALSRLASVGMISLATGVETHSLLPVFIVLAVLHALVLRVEGFFNRFVEWSSLPS
jgi:hypothetical protein